jgi:hypothetical protein
VFFRFFIGDKLNKINTLIVKRIEYELKRRIFDPYLNQHFGWMNGTNNWNPWINANILRSALYTTHDHVVRNEIIVKAIECVDHFVNHYPEDGGCDEGPRYWNFAGGKLIEFIDLLNSFSNGLMDWSKNELIHRMGSYIHKLYIGKGHFVNFADAPAEASCVESRVMRYGLTFKDEKLTQFAAHLQKEYELINKKNAFTLAMEYGRELRVFGEIEFISNYKNTKPIAPFEAEAWLPNLQVFTLRTKEGSTDGLFFGVKGGTNGKQF